jgi:hypothetical protein
MGEILSRNLKREVKRLNDREAGERIYDIEYANRYLIGYKYREIPLHIIASYTYYLVISPDKIVVDVLKPGYPETLIQKISVKDLHLVDRNYWLNDNVPY